MAGPIDLEVNRQVRKILIRHWIDLGRVLFRSVQGSVTVRGTLERIAGVSEPLTPTIVATIFFELKRAPDVRRLTVDLTNWKEEAGNWKRVEASDITPAAPPSTGVGGTYRIADSTP
ncbi:MAG: hypothetical protein A2498_11380 [Lentisphaerae bacterium RIFOXYC12_FULL_60_16]|nr:MAG: hypothetical protein A2498_11380 [Lentisphaerae bacterium RIFOXYC12_FULL_60_16]OGV71875.1 MAG: hypothetical protein A2269_00850 [Lentisphaerae bacterium RIFOXYA12_FULL_60_10]OGV85735.1 MAG: hypothetical protein A2340_15365 [Lentisphaerae bacterium RIFOXYB12_FULL_60_10]